MANNYMILRNKIFICGLRMLCSLRTQPANRQTLEPGRDPSRQLEAGAGGGAPFFYSSAEQRSFLLSMKKQRTQSFAARAAGRESSNAS